ncbi:hypothetical protein ACH50O_17875 [Methylomonas sp. 2BW1-5-20]|uniref:hypothetical protein n=1 Tax=Methylomonas sp. 2BW1-5-20 TaxID=3376686 RepID=UPI004052C859
MTISKAASPLVYQCMFCAESIAPTDMDPCALNIIARIDRPREVQKEQMFYCHIDCLKSHSSIHPGNFYITDPNFSTVGEFASE